MNPASSFSAYLAMTSTSRFTGSPTVRAPSVVTDIVCGMSATENSVSSMSTTVRLTPSTVIDPFSTMYRASPSGSRTRRSGAGTVTSPTASTWPCTR